MTRKTRVVVQTTTITFFNALKNKLDTTKTLGKANAIEARKLVADLCLGNTYITKTTVSESFLVDTTQLYALKED